MSQIGPGAWAVGGVLRILEAYFTLYFTHFCYTLPPLCARPTPTPLNPHRPVTCAKRDLHSGVFGGSVHEAMTDLVQLMSRLVTTDGKILVPGIYHDVKAITDDERNAYTDLAFDCQEYAKVC